MIEQRVRREMLSGFRAKGIWQKIAPNKSAEPCWTGFCHDDRLSSPDMTPEESKFTKKTTSY